MLTLLIVCIIIGGLIASNNKNKSALGESMKLFFGTIGCLGVVIIFAIIFILVFFI